MTRRPTRGKPDRELRKAREAAGLTRAAAAPLTGLSARTLMRYELGQAQPTPLTRQGLLDAYRQAIPDAAA
jgi:transcriptional regulator with XRE-family HTH domain